MAGIFIFGLGMLFFVGAVFDVEWFMNMTRSARHGYPFGKTFSRLFYGTIGLFSMIGGLSILLAS